MKLLQQSSTATASPAETASARLENVVDGGGVMWVDKLIDIYIYNLMKVHVLHSLTMAKMIKLHLLLNQSVPWVLQ